MNVYLTGAHGCGKTTLVNQLEFKTKPSVARTSPYEMGTAENQRFVTQKIYKECMTLDGYALSRTPIDTSAYTRLWSLHSVYEYDKQMLEFFRRTDPLIFYLPVEFALENDGFRPGEKEQKLVDKFIKETLDAYNFRYVTLSGSVKERLEKLNKEI